MIARSGPLDHYCGPRFGLEFSRVGVSCSLYRIIITQAYSRPRAYARVIEIRHGSYEGSAWIPGDRATKENPPLELPSPCSNFFVLSSLLCFFVGRSHRPAVCLKSNSAIALRGREGGGRPGEGRQLLPASCTRVYHFERASVRDR